MKLLILALATVSSLAQAQFAQPYMGGLYGAAPGYPSMMSPYRPYGGGMGGMGMGFTNYFPGGALGVGIGFGGMGMGGMYPGMMGGMGMGGFGGMGMGMGMPGFAGGMYPGMGMGMGGMYPGMMGGMGMGGFGGMGMGMGRPGFAGGMSPGMGMGMGGMPMGNNYGLGANNYRSNPYGYNNYGANNYQNRNYRNNNLNTNTYDNSYDDDGGYYRKPSKKTVTKKSAEVDSSTTDERYSNSSADVEIKEEDRGGETEARPEEIVVAKNDSEPESSGDQVAATNPEYKNGSATTVVKKQPKGIKTEKVTRPVGPNLIARTQAERSAQRAPIWPSFVKNWKQCAPGCQPTEYAAWGRRGGPSCHPTGQAIDVGAMICNGQKYKAINRGRFEVMVNCMRKKMKTLYRNGADVTLGHHDHVHLSNGCHGGRIW